MSEKPNVQLIDNLKQKVFKHWVGFNVLTLFCFLVFSLLYLFQQWVLCFLSLAITFCFFYLIIDVKFVIAELDPNRFLNTENMNKIISKVLWRFLYPAIIAILVSAMIIQFYFTAWVAVVSPFFSATFFGFFIIFIWFALYQTLMIGNPRKKPRLLKVRARAYFRLAISSMKNPPANSHGKVVSFLLRFFAEKKSDDVEKRNILIKAFSNGVNDLNSLLAHQFSSEFSDTQKYVNYFRYVACLEKCSEKDRVSRVLEVMANKLNRKVELSEITWTARQIFEEKPFMTHGEVYQDLDFKAGLSKWYNHNKEGVQLTLLIIPIFISIVALLF